MIQEKITSTIVVANMRATLKAWDVGNKFTIDRESLTIENKYSTYPFIKTIVHVNKKRSINTKSVRLAMLITITH
jgi:hypothetical protein